MRLWPFGRRRGQTDAFGRPITGYGERAAPPAPHDDGRAPDATPDEVGIPVRRGFDGKPLKQSGAQSGHTTGGFGGHA